MTLSLTPYNSKGAILRKGNKTVSETLSDQALMTAINKSALAAGPHCHHVRVTQGDKFLGDYDIVEGHIHVDHVHIPEGASNTEGLSAEALAAQAAELAAAAAIADKAAAVEAKAAAKAAADAAKAEAKAARDAAKATEAAAKVEANRVKAQAKQDALEAKAAEKEAADKAKAVAKAQAVKDREAAATDKATAKAARDAAKAAGKPVSTPRTTGPTKKEQVLTYLEAAGDAGEGRSVDDIATHMGISTSAAGSLLGDLRAAKQTIETKPKAAPARGVTYFVTRKAGTSAPVTAPVEDATDTTTETQPSADTAPAADE